MKRFRVSLLRFSNVIPFIFQNISGKKSLVSKTQLNLSQRLPHVWANLQSSAGAVVMVFQSCTLGDDCMVVEWLPDIEC